MQDGKASSILFKADENFERATTQLYILGNDLLFDSTRDYYVRGSSFYNDVKKFFNNLPDKEIKIKELKIESDRAQLFE